MEHLALLKQRQTGEKMAKLGRIETGDSGPPETPGYFDTTLQTPKNTAGTNRIL
jgi:hypothetical protein